MSTAADAISRPDSRLPKASAKIALTLLVLINLFNYIDRQILSAVESNMEETFFPEADYPRDPETKLRLDKTIEGQMGSLNSAFMFSYILIAPLFGLLADRVPRWLLVGIGVVFWSLATGATGLAETFVVLFLTRCLVGVGEAAYGPVAPTVIADLFPVSKRGSVMALFYAAIPVGSALGYVLGGVVTHLAGGDWRWAFYVVVPPGLLLGLWCFLMRDPPRGLAEASAVVRKPSLADYRLILKTPSYLFTTLGMTAMTFALGGMAFWMPRYGVQRQLVADMTSEEISTLRIQVNLVFGLIVVVSGLGGTVVGGIVADRLKARIPGAYFLVSAIAIAVAFPFVLCTLVTPFPAAWIFVFLACFCLFFNTGPTNTILANVTHPSTRASAFAMNILIIHLLGDAISPTIIGIINGYSGNMNIGFLAVSGTCLVASFFWILGIKHLERDTELAPTRTPP
ncbi:MAG: MFS transporter [Gemmataceae bacterium]|nr:MFS transporter [Gemmataceae bacterium]